MSCSTTYDLAKLAAELDLERATTVVDLARESTLVCVCVGVPNDGNLTWRADPLTWRDQPVTWRAA
jgi:hypothetical protein